METSPDFERAALCVADTKLVLGNVCVKSVFNGRSIGDFATLLAISGTSFGATRSMYRWLESRGQSYVWLERGRGPHEIASMDLLDAPPVSWVDLMTTLFLCEAATSALSKSISKDSDAFLANQLRMLERDSAFHMAYALGWLKVSVEEQQELLRLSVRARLPLAMRWLSSDDSQAVVSFLQSCKPLAELSSEPLPAAALRSSAWNAELSRECPLPDSLFEIVRFKDAELLA